MLDGTEVRPIDTQPSLRNAGRLVSELLIIVVGVLAALAVDQWREDARARTSESQYVRRLIVDLAADSAQAVVPSASWGSGPNPGMSPAELDSTFYADPGADERLRKLMSPEYRGLLNQERIYARSMEEISEDMLGLIVVLLQELRAYEEALN